MGTPRRAVRATSCDAAVFGRRSRARRVQIAAPRSRLRAPPSSDQAGRCRVRPRAPMVSTGVACFAAARSPTPARSQSSFSPNAARRRRYLAQLTSATRETWTTASRSLPMRSRARRRVSRLRVLGATTAAFLGLHYRKCLALAPRWSNAPARFAPARNTCSDGGRAFKRVRDPRFPRSEAVQGRHDAQSEQVIAFEGGLSYARQLRRWLRVRNTQRPRASDLAPARIWPRNLNLSVLVPISSRACGTFRRVRLRAARPAATKIIYTADARQRHAARPPWLRGFRLATSDTFHSESRPNGRPLRSRFNSPGAPDRLHRLQSSTLRALRAG